MIIEGTYLSVGRLRFHLARFIIKARATLLVFYVSEITDQQDNPKYKTERTNNQKRYVFCIVVFCIISSYEASCDGQEQKYTNGNQYPADQNERPVEPSWVTNVIQGST